MLRATRIIVWLSWLSAIAVISGGCDRTSQQADLPTAIAETAIPSLAPNAKAAFSPGRYCYQTKTENLTAHVRINIGDQGQISGDTQATIHNNQASYYSSYWQKLNGTLQDRAKLPALAKLDVTTWIEYDVQPRTETWSLTPKTLTVQDKTTLQSADCAVVSKAFQNEAGLEAADLLDFATAVHRKPWALSVRDQPITAHNSVIRGERDVYEFTAKGGDFIVLRIQSVESNAVFDVISPSGMIVAQESQREDRLLPQTGQYQVVVGGTRGNATYTLTAQLRDRT